MTVNRFSPSHLPTDKGKEAEEVEEFAPNHELKPSGFQDLGFSG